MDEEMSIRQIGLELDKIEARIDELQRLSDSAMVEIEEIAVKVKFYELIMGSWKDEDE
jgi:hypothetical protein